ncbi:MAG: MMPL family transporter, partial [Thermodesulfobacteriota bacterium]|nr:MMPL family transporter [Thermodesulfobacteriota bacterium]
MIYRFSKLVIDYRHLFFVIIFILSVFFGYHAFKTEMVSNFEDLIPRNHHYVKLHREFKNLFGGANLISIAVEVKNGDIFNRDTLNKIKAINDMIELTHGVNNYQIHSIARHNVKDIRATSWGIEANSLMYPYVPETQEEIDKLRDVIYGNEAVYGKLVSRDGKAALIQADFWEKRLDYRYLFNRVVKTCRSLEDENTNIYVAGEPILYGWVYHHFREIFFIMLVTILAIILLLVFYIRRLEGVIIPLISAFITGLWGLGFTKLFGFNFDPLTLIIPFVIGARTISHSIQMTERFFEEYKELRDEKAAAIMSLNGLLMPGFVSIVTDACGVLVIAIAPIPILQKLAFIGSLWVLTNLVSVLILAPILYTYFPIHKIKSEREGQGRIDYFFKIAGFWCVGRRSKGVILGFTILLVAWSGYNLKNLCVGDVNPGSPILWHDSEYNRSVARINSKF